MLLDSQLSTSSAAAHKLRLKRHHAEHFKLCSLRARTFPRDGRVDILSQCCQRASDVGRSLQGHHSPQRYCGYSFHDNFLAVGYQCQFSVIDTKLLYEFTADCIYQWTRSKV